MPWWMQFIGSFLGAFLVMKYGWWKGPLVGWLSSPHPVLLSFLLGWATYDIYHWFKQVRQLNREADVVMAHLKEIEDR